MRGVERAWLAVLALLLSALAAGQTDGEKVYKAVSDSVVTIAAGESTGTGFLVKNSSTIVTAAHVVDNGEIPVVKFRKSSFLVVKSMIISKALDLAILETEDAMAAKPLPLGDRDVPSLGALQNTMTDGMLSGIRKVGPTELIQITAPCSPGMSGGPILSSSSKVLGVISFSFEDGQNLNIAVAAKHVRELLAGRLRPVEDVCAELKAKAAPATPNTTRPTPTEKEEVNETAKSILQKARVSALADLYSTTFRWVRTGLEDSYRLYVQSSTGGDWERITDAWDVTKRRIPLITIGGKEYETEVSDKIELLFDTEEFDTLATLALALSKNTTDAAFAAGRAVISRWSATVTQSRKDSDWSSYQDTVRRSDALLSDLMQKCLELSANNEQFMAEISPYCYSRWASYFRASPDPDRPDRAGIKWGWPNSQLDGGDTIIGLAVGDSQEELVENWQQVSWFLSKIKEKTDVKVRTRRGTVVITFNPP